MHYHLPIDPGSRLKGRSGGNRLNAHSGLTMWTKHWGIWSQRSSLISRKDKALIVFLPLFKEKCHRLSFWAIQNGEKIVSHKVLGVENQFVPSCMNTEARRSWILFLWLHTGVHTGRSSDPGVGTYTFHNNVHLRRPLDETVVYICHSHTAYRTYGQVKVRIAASWDYANNSLFVSINKTNAELCAVLSV